LEEENNTTDIMKRVQKYKKGELRTTNTEGISEVASISLLPGKRTYPLREQCLLTRMKKGNWGQRRVSWS